MTEFSRLTALVHGRVQGVYFRYFVRNEAVKRDLTGYAYNRADGSSVEVVAEGPRWELEALLARLHVGPPAARVETVEVCWSDATGAFSEFSVG